MAEFVGYREQTLLKNGATLTNAQLPRREGELQPEDLKDLPVGTEIAIVYHTRATKGHMVSRDYRGVQDGVLTLRVYRTANYGKQIGFDDIGRRKLEEYQPAPGSTLSRSDVSPC